MKTVRTGYIQTRTAIVYAQPNVCPPPIPCLLDRCHDVIEDEISCRELLVPEICANVSTVECKICQEAARAIFNEDTLMLCPGSRRHLEYNVLETSGLSGWPVDCLDERVGWYGCCVDNKISDLPPEYVCRSTWLLTIVIWLTYA